MTSKGKVYPLIQKFHKNITQLPFTLILMTFLGSAMLDLVVYKVLVL